MAQTILLYQKCPQCNGTALFQSSADPDSEPITCNWPGCVEGFIQCDEVRLDPGLDDIMDKLNDVKDQCDAIMEKLNE